MKSSIKMPVVSNTVGMVFAGLMMSQLATADAASQFSGANIDSNVTLHRVRYESPSTGDMVDNANFPQWDLEGVSDDDEEQTFVAVVHDPGFNSVQNIVIFFPGQQDGDAAPYSGTTSAVTGQYDGWYDAFNGESEVLGVDGRSLHRKVMRYFASSQGTPFYKGNTFIALAFNHAFYYSDGNDADSDMIVAAFKRFLLTSNADPANVKRVYLAGASRGGALAMRLAQAITEDGTMGHIQVLVSDYDAVLNEDGEGGSSGEEVDNPLVSGEDVYGWKADLNTFYQEEDKLKILQVVGGYEVVAAGIPLGVHAYALPSDQLASVSNFYEQVWVDLDHSAICQGDTNGVTDMHLDWLARQTGYVPTTQIALADFNGDGISDVFKPTGNSTNGWKVSYSGTGAWQTLLTGSYTQFPLSDYKLGDFNGDGKTDILYINSSGSWWVAENGTSWRTTLTGNSKSPDDLQVHDMNGDGKDDVVHFSRSTSTGIRYYSGGADSGGHVTFSQANAYLTGTNSNYQADAYLLGDVTGDGKAELIYPTVSDDLGGIWWTYFPATATSTSYSHAQPAQTLQMADLNGDSIAEVFWATADTGSSNGWKKYQYSSGFQTVSTLKTGTDTGAFARAYKLGDFNNDGKDDVFYANGSTWKVSYSGTGAWTTLSSKTEK